MVGGQGRVSQLFGSFYANDGQPGWIEKPNLHQHRSLIPVDVLVGKLPIAKVDNYHQRALHPLTCGSNSRKHPVHFDGVRKAKNHFVHQPLRPDRSGHRNDLRVRRHLGDEVLRIEFSQLFEAHAAGQHRDVVHVGVEHHGLKRCFRVPSREFLAEVLFPKIVE